MPIVRPMTQSALALLREAVREAVESEGLRPFAERTGVPLGVVRGAQGDQNLTAASIARLAEALGLEFYVGPSRGGPPRRAAGMEPPGLAEPAAVFRMSAPGEDAWARLDRPAPDGPFFLACAPGAGLGEGITHCLVEPEAELVAGGEVYLEDHEGRVALGRYEGTNPETGWVRVLRHGARMVDERAPGALRRLWPVTWTGRTPPPPAMAELVSALSAAMQRRRAARQAIDEALAELRARLMKVLD